jgi:hypothetical protein
MHDPTTRDIWQTAFGKDFGGMAQGDNKTGQQGTNSIFVMTHDDIRHIPTDRTITYARVVVDFRPQKTDPHRVRITAGGNLINYLGELTTKTADLTTSKLMWNSVLSTEGAKYMCLYIKNFYLSAPLDRFEHIKMPISLFPSWTREQYNLDTHAKNGFVYLKMRRAVHAGWLSRWAGCHRIISRHATASHGAGSLSTSPLDAQPSCLPQLVVASLRHRHRLSMCRLVVTSPLITPPSCFPRLVFPSPLVAPPPLNTSSPRPTLTIPPPHCRHCPPPLSSPAALVTNLSAR